MSGATFTRSMIPNRLPPATYQIGVSATYLKVWLDEGRNDYGVDLQPDFQRPLVWDETRKTAYVEFLLRNGKGDARNITFNSPAFAQHKPEASDLDHTLLLVDGQQRLNALLEFLDNKVTVFGGYRLEDFDSDARRDALGASGTLSLNIFVNSLATMEEVLTYYLELNEGGMAHTAEELDRVRAMREKVRAA